MIQQLENLMNEYTRWLKDKTVVKQVDNSHWVEITTPFLDRHNDCLQIYVREDGDGFILTDDGYTISDLISSGYSPDNLEHRKLLNTTLAGFGVKMNEKQELFVNATRKNFPQKKHNLIQAMLVASNLFVV